MNNIKMMASPRQSAKAFVAAVVAILGVAVTAASDSAFTLEEWLTMALAGVTAFQGVWWVPNKP